MVRRMSCKPGLAAALSLFVLAACPPKSGTQTAPPQQQPLTGPGCPPAANVYIASYLTQEASKGRTGWVIPLHSMKIEPNTKVPDYSPLDEAAASVSGVPAITAGNLWLMTGNAAPCQGKLGSHYASKLDGPPASISYGVELEGCPAPADPNEAGGLVMVAPEAPTGCQLDAPQPIAARLGEMTQGQPSQWQRPTKETPIPPALAAAIPPHDCRAPGCETLWAVGQVDFNNAPAAWSAAVNWLTVGDPATPCQWKAERFSGFFIPGPDGRAMKVTEGQDHPLVLSAVMIDRNGPRGVLAEGPGEFATYDLAPGKATLGHHLTWMLASTAAWDAVDHLGPLCEPPQATPAPLPKDAKPISPYP
jgi:hypothetical protein